MYIDRIMPFLKDSDFVSNTLEQVPLTKIYCPLEGDFSGFRRVEGRPFKLYHVLPCDVYVVGEPDGVALDIKKGLYGETISANVITVDYGNMARRVEIEDGRALVAMGGAYSEVEDVVTDVFVNTASNGVKTSMEFLDGVAIEYVPGFNFRDWIQSEKVNEEPDLARFEKNFAKGGGKIDDGYRDDHIYKILDSYFAIPEGEDGDRETTPLLVGPTAVFKSATVKALCKKYNFRMVDFRVSFTARLDFAGLIQTGHDGDELYSYSCPMEELVTCSDGFRLYCKRAHAKIQEILAGGQILANKTSDGGKVIKEMTDLKPEQRVELERMLGEYEEYLKTPVLFFDEITRTEDGGVEGILVQLLNQKKFKDLTFKNCKFVSATNANLVTGNMRHDGLMMALDDLYDVNSNLDVAYTNRFQPLKVLPNDVAGRWYEWAEKTKMLHGEEVLNIHPVIMDFLKSPKGRVSGESLLYNMSPVLDAIEEGRTDEEKKSQPFPNYRTWEMTSDYLHAIDREEAGNPQRGKIFRETIIHGLISSWAGEIFCSFLRSKGYKSNIEADGDVADDVGDFLKSTLDAGVPAMMIGPSSLGKTSRVKAYMKSVEKKTGLKPILIDVNLASMDTVDVVGMPIKQSITEYVAGTGMVKMGLGDVAGQLKDLVKTVKDENPEMGLVDTLTLRAPDMPMVEAFKRALRENREIILFFDECNRVRNKTIMSAMFEAISDQRIFGISFKEQKDRVKIVGACNMGHSEMGANADGEVGQYNNAGSLDPALAARFSIFWKKNYDEKDVKSFISYLESEKEDGMIDGIVLDFFKNLPVEDALRAMASVEKRTLSYAEPSSRALNQLSKDIKAMRGAKSKDGFNKSLFNGKILFNDLMIKQFTELNMDARGSFQDVGDIVAKAQALSHKITSQAGVWEPHIVGDTIVIDGEEMPASDVIFYLKSYTQDITDISMRPLTTDSKAELRAKIDIILALLDACNRLDARVVDDRRKIMETYVGESFTNDFLPFFNDVFGSVNDVEITIAMLADDTLIEPFTERFYAKMSSLTTDDMVEKVLGLIREFWSVHGATLPNKNYAMLLTSVKHVLPSTDSLNELLIKSGKTEDEFFAMAEGYGDGFILDILKNYPGSFTPEDIESMRQAIAGGGVSKDKKRSRIL